MSTCCCPQGLLTLSEKELNDYVTKEIFLHQEPGLLRLQDICRDNGINLADIAEVRFELSRLVPFKLAYCNANLRCCGQCMKRCTKRCVQDVIYRFWMMLQGPEKNVYTIAAKGLLRRESITYEQIRLLVEDQLCVKTHKQLKEYSENFHNLSGFLENPYRYDYEPQKIKDARGVVVDEITHEIALQNWPSTGLCPYCLPSRMVVRRRSFKDRQV